MQHIVAIILPLLLYVPGYVLSHAIPGASPDDALELHFERVVSSTLLNGWLALLLAELGIFSLWLHLAVVALACAFFFVLGLRFASPRMRSASKQSTSSPACTLKDVATSDSLWFGLALLVALVLVLPPFEVILGVRDAGVYSNTGFALARTGGLIQHDTLLAELGQAAHDPDPAVRGPAEQAMSNFLGVQHPERFIATRMRAAGFFINEGDAPRGLVTPQGFHLFPVWIGLLTSILGVAGGLFAPGLMATLGAWSVGMLGRRLAGRWTGLLALLFLALNSVQVWFGRYSTSETTTQFLTFAGLYFFARWQQHRPHSPEYLNRQERQERQEYQECQDRAAGQLDGHSSTSNTRITASYYAALAGIAFGQFALTRIDFFLVVGPVLLYLLYCWLAHHWQRGHTALALGLGTMLVHAGLHVIFISRAYFFDTAYARLQDYAITAYAALPFITPLLREVYHTRTGSPFKNPLRLWQELAAVATGIGMLLAVWRWPQPLHAIERLAQRWRTVGLTGAALLIVALSGYTYLIRPNILTLDVLAAIPGCLTPQHMANPQGACLTLQGYVGAPVAIPVPQQAPDPLLLKEANPVAYYDAGVIALLSHMQHDHPRYAEVEAARQRLPELVRQHDAATNAATSNPDLTRQRDALLAQLDDISREVIRFSFDELCQLNIPTPKIDDKYVIPRANFVRVGWYLFPLGIALGVLGFALWVWRGLDRASWLFLVIGLLGTFFYIRQTYGTSDQTYIYILRRFVPIAYPAFSLGMAYALTFRVQPHSGTDRVARKGAKTQRPDKGPDILHNAEECEERKDSGTTHGSVRSSRLSSLLTVARWGLAGVMIAFFVWTGQPIYRHVEYAGAVNQIAHMAARFEPDDVLLFRGGGPTYGHFRDVPDLVTTPLHFLYGLDALTVKSSQPAAYAGALADQVRHWQAQGRSVYLVLSASGGDCMLPGFGLVPAGDVVLSLPEFEQLTNQKPRNVSTLRLPLAIYRLDGYDSDSQTAGTLALPLTATDVAAQVRGFYLSEPYIDSTSANTDASTGNGNGDGDAPAMPVDSYAWTDGDALLRVYWDEQSPPDSFDLYLAGGLRPAHLGPAEVCLSLVADTLLPLPQADDVDHTVSLGCRSIGNAMQPHEVVLDPQAIASLTAAAPGRILLRIESTAWVPAEEDPRQIDQRSVGVQFGGLTE